MPTDAEDRTTLDALRDTLNAVPGPMREAFTARLRTLERGMASSAPLPDDQQWWDAWYDQVVAIVHLSLDDPRSIAQAAALVRWGVAGGITPERQRRAFDALAWACRDIAPDRMTPSALAAIEARESLIARVGRRLEAPPVGVSCDATEGRRG